MKCSATTTIHLRGKDARNFIKAVAAERTQANEGSEESRHVPLLIAMEAAQRELLARLEKAEAERGALVEALEECIDVMETTDDTNMQKAIIEALKQARAALARVKGAV